MAAEMRLYRVTVVGSNAERKRGKVVEEVTVKVGTKWLTDDNGRRYYKVPLEDANRNLYFQLNTMYCMVLHGLPAVSDRAGRQGLPSASGTACGTLQGGEQFRLQRSPACAGEGHGYAEIHPVRTAPYQRHQYADGHGCGWRAGRRRKE